MRLEDVFATVFGQTAETFDDTSSQDTVSEWTSMRNVALLVAVENAYGIRFSNVEMATVRNLGDIRAVLEQRGVPVG
jgi:acyl carrier protein